MLIKIIDFDFSTHMHITHSLLLDPCICRAKKNIKNLVSIGRNYKLKIFH